MKRLKFTLKSFFNNCYSLSVREMDRLQCKVGFVSDETAREQIAAFVGSLRPMTRPDVPLIRFGPAQDGGYLLPDDLEGISACFSPGVSDISGFEFQCAERGMKVFLADASVDCPPVSHSNFSFTKKFVGAAENDITMTMDRWVKQSAPSLDGDFLLQMDIEGAEYQTILATSPEVLSRFRIIVMELHDLDHLWCRPFFTLASAMFEKLLATHVCSHIHPNNIGGNFTKHGISIPPLCEFTFTRRDRMQHAVPNRNIPHPLDCDNDPYRSSVKVDRCWLDAI